MSAGNGLAVMRCAALAAMLALPTSGCTYDYLQHTDRVAYSAGNAVAANLESETINPSKHSMYVTSGLGRNGPIGPLPATGPGAPAPSPTDTAPPPAN